MELSEKISILPSILNLKRQVVGVKIIKNKENYDFIEAKQIKNKITYCYMIKLATYGKHFKAKAENFLCDGASKALGLMTVPDNVISGQVYESLGLYENREVAKEAQRDVKYIKEKNYGVEIFSLNNFPAKEFDVAIIIDSSYKIMRLMQGYSYYYGVNKNISFSGNQGICSEATAVPYINDDVNASMLCSGTRFFAKWNEDDIAFGIPYSKMSKVIDGVINTINPTESDEKKQEIIKKLKDKDINLNIELGKNYYI
ncbi:DUF169 domain-containing protein [Haloimpatiens sp. FM7315]|uniref:DUF169 domain-containing protein n=1 Tax=Haloimpatiens sp. FM7315 TaxID=3298609 RepID=UPI0035A34FEC